MTNLEWLAKMPHNDAWGVMDEYCPYHTPTGRCPADCEHDVDGTCIDIALALGEFALWLIKERKEDENAN